MKILFEELGIEEEAASTESAWPTLALLTKSLGEHGYTIEDVKEWTQLCDPKRTVTWNRVECFRHAAKTRLREPESPLRVYATVGIASFGAALVLARLWRR